LQGVCSPPKISGGRLHTLRLENAAKSTIADFGFIFMPQYSLCLLPKFLFPYFLESVNGSFFFVRIVEMVEKVQKVKRIEGLNKFKS
jgi:hypothetical protein